MSEIGHIKMRIKGTTSTAAKHRYGCQKVLGFNLTGFLIPKAVYHKQEQFQMSKKANKQRETDVTPAENDGIATTETKTAAQTATPKPKPQVQAETPPMAFTVLRDTFLEALQLTSKTVNPKSTLLVLSHVYISADETGVTMQSTTLDYGMEVQMGASVSASGALCAPAAKLLELIRACDMEELIFQVSEENQRPWLSLVGDGGNMWNLACIYGSEWIKFPHRPTGDPIAKFQTSQFRTAMNQARVTVDKGKEISAVRPVLTYINMEFSAGSAQFVATDGHRLSRVVVDADCEYAPNILIPNQITAVADILAKQAGERLSFHKSDDATTWGKMISITDDSKHLWWIQTLETYPDCQPIIPTDASIDHTFTLNWAAMNQTLKTCRALEDHDRRVELKFMGGDSNTVQMSVKDNSKGNYGRVNLDLVDKTKIGSAFEVWFNSLHFAECFNALKRSAEDGTVTIKVSLRLPGSCLLLPDPNHELHSYLIMLMVQPNTKV